MPMQRGDSGRNSRHLAFDPVKAGFGRSPARHEQRGRR